MPTRMNPNKHIHQPLQNRQPVPYSEREVHHYVSSQMCSNIAEHGVINLIVDAESKFWLYSGKIYLPVMACLINKNITWFRIQMLSILLQTLHTCLKENTFHLKPLKTFEEECTGIKLPLRNLSITKI